jgi:hypothetical protein
MRDKHEKAIDHIINCQNCYNYIRGLAIAASTSRAGSVVTEAKAKAAKENGKLGGRPRKR